MINKRLLEILKEQQEISCKEEYDLFYEHADTVEMTETEEGVYYQFRINLGVFYCTINEVGMNQDFSELEDSEYSQKIRYFNDFEEMTEKMMIGEYFKFYERKHNLLELTQFADYCLDIALEYFESLPEVYTEKGSLKMLNEADWDKAVKRTIKRMYQSHGKISQKKAKELAIEDLLKRDIYPEELYEGFDLLYIYNMGKKLEWVGFSSDDKIMYNRLYNYCMEQRKVA